MFFSRIVGTRKFTIVTRRLTHSFTKVAGRLNSDRREIGKRGFWESKDTGDDQNQSVQGEEGNDQDSLVRGELKFRGYRLPKGNSQSKETEVTHGSLQAPKPRYWERYKIKHNPSIESVKTHFSTPSWMLASWTKKERASDWWTGKHATEKSQRQEAYGDIYPLEIPTRISINAYSDDSDTVAQIRSVGVGVPINLVQRKSLLNEAKKAVTYRHVLRALRMRNPHELLQIMAKLAEAYDGDITSSPIYEIPPNTFSEILRLLDPKHFFGRYQGLLEDFKHKDLLELRIDTLDHEGTHRAYTVFLWHLHRLMLKRRLNRYPPSLSDYKLLLKAAKFTGCQAVADLTWHALLSNRSQVVETRRIVPDVECFNYYMATMCWSDTLSPFHADKLRVVSHHKELRQWERRPHLFSRHRLGGDYGIKITVSRLFREMSAAGLIGDEETFRSLMVAASREGDLETVQAILKRVWQIDIDESRSHENFHVNKYAPDSPLYPNTELIRTMVHVYCINNDLPMAMRVIDKISRKYSIKIPVKAWQDVLGWTAVFARKKGSVFHQEKGLDEGILPPSGMKSVWLSMISEPYNIKPTLRMYNVYIRHLLSTRQIGEAQAQMVQAYQLHSQLVKTALRYRYLYESSLKKRKSDSMITSSRRRDFVYHQLKLKISRMYMRSWVSYLISKPSKFLTKYHADWAFQRIPMIVQGYNSFLQGKISYQTYTGHVVLHTGKVRNTKVRIWRRRYGDKTSSRRRRRRWLGILLRRASRRVEKSKTKGSTRSS